MIFADKKYPVNIKNGKAFIYPANSLSLGDNILMTIISQGYFRDNPGEVISLVPFNDDILKLIRIEKPDKLFLRMDSTCVTDDDILELKELTDVFEFELHREAHGLWEQGIYPVFEKKYSLLDLCLPVTDYVVFHIRNIQTIKDKNTDEFVVRKIFRLLEAIIVKFKKLKIVLLGNDNILGLEGNLRIPDYFLIDLRNQLSLNEIASVIRNCQVFIGSDSGIAHLAGCCDVPMVSWNYVNRFWFPKVRNSGQCTFLTKNQSKIEIILSEIKERILDHADVITKEMINEWIRE